MKPLPVRTNYIHPRLDISGPGYSNVMFGKGNPYRILSNKCLDMEKSCRTCFWEQVINLL